MLLQLDSSHHGGEGAVARREPDRSLGREGTVFCLWNVTDVCIMSSFNRKWKQSHLPLPGSSAQPRSPALLPCRAVEPMQVWLLAASLALCIQAQLSCWLMCWRTGARYLPPQALLQESRLFSGNMQVSTEVLSPEVEPQQLTPQASSSAWVRIIWTTPLQVCDTPLDCMCTWGGVSKPCLCLGQICILCAPIFSLFQYKREIMVLTPWRLVVRIKMNYHM